MKLGITQINIGEPCSEQWAQMTPEGKGKHCAKCEKTVVDFTQMSDTKMLEYLKYHPNSCGRFYNHQLNREIPVYETESLAFKVFRKAALTGIFATQLWTRKAEAQEMDKDTLANTAVVSQQAINNQSIFQKTVSGRVIQPDSTIHKALGLRFTIDTFSIEVELAKTNEFSFQLPFGFEKDSMDVELFTLDTTICFKDIQLSDNGFSFQQQNLENELIFQFTSSWTYYKTFRYHPPPITMGIWVDNRSMFDTGFMHRPFIMDSTLKSLIYTLGNVISLNPKGDSVHKAELKKAKDIYWSKRKENKTSVWWWLLLPFSMIVIFIKWVSRKGMQHEEPDSAV